KDALGDLVAAAELHPTNSQILVTLARTSFEQGDLERAERTYHSLLLLLRHSSEQAAAEVCRAEVYIELSELAVQKNELDRATDLSASAFEVAMENDEEALGLERALRRRGKIELLERAVESRLSRAVDPRAQANALATLVEFQLERAARDGLWATSLVE